MGLDVNGTRFLLFCRTIGVDFSKFAMIGRQGLHLSPADLENNFLEFGIFFDEPIVRRIFSQDGYAEEFLKFLGAQEIDSFDNSSYEKATYLHDMNREIPNNFRAQYSTILDGGSLEHIFNFPQAIKNCMEMVRVGGHYLGITPANNFFGHGFYQFSPELFFSVFTERNGYERPNVFAFEASKRTWFSVSDPAAVQSRVTLTNCEQVYLLVIAKRTREAQIFEFTPQQSDYVSIWKKSDHASTAIITSNPQSTVKPIFSTLISRRLRCVAGRFFAKQSAFDPKFFELIDPAKLAREMQTKPNVLSRI